MRYPNGVSTLVADSETGPLVRKAFDLFGTGLHTKKDVLKTVTALGLRTRVGKKMSPQAFDNMLRNPLYAGWLKVPSWNVNTRAAFSALVPPDTFERVQILLARRGHRAENHRREHPDFPLRHFVRCADCGRPLTGSWSRGRAKRYAYYHCPGCRMTATKQALEVQFLALVERLRPRPEYLRLFHQVVLDVWRTKQSDALALEADLRQKSDALRERKHRLVEAFIYKAAIDQATYQEQLDRLNEEITMVDLERHDAQLEGLDVEAVLRYGEFLANNAARLWADADLGLKRSLQAVPLPRGTAILERSVWNRRK